MERILASVVFADLSGFTAMADAASEDAYLAFIAEFRGIVYDCIAPLLAHNRLEYGFWGDEVKVVLIGPTVERNAIDALEYAKDLVIHWDAAPSNEARRRAGQDPLRFKIGIATHELLVGMFPGARAPESEGRPLCTARSLSKRAKGGSATRIYVDDATRTLLIGRVGQALFVPVPEHDAWEVEWSCSA